MALAFTTHGYIEVYYNDVLVSRHRMEQEAFESIFNHAEHYDLEEFNYTIVYPPKSAKGRRRNPNPPTVVTGFISGQGLL